MNYLKNVLEFHLEVFKKISTNLYFFIFVYLVYLASDIVIYYQTTQGPTSAFADHSKMIDLSSVALINWGIYIFVFLSYLVTPCLLSLYYSKQHAPNSSIWEKVKTYLKPVINFRMYLVYSLFLLSIAFSFSVGVRFIPEVVNGFIPAILEYVKLHNDANLSAQAIENSKIINDFIATILSVKWYEWFMFVFSIITIILFGFSAFIFSLPLVIKSKNNGFFHSIKLSFKYVFNNFAYFTLTILLFLLIKLLVYAFTFEISYVGKLISIFFSSLFLFYIIVGLEKFILEKRKK